MHVDFGALAVQADGRVLLAGSGSDDVLVRLTASGALDPSFGTSGIVRTATDGERGPSDMVVQPDGRILVAGSSAWQLTIRRYLLSGAPDPTFGKAGMTKIGKRYATAGDLRSMVLEPDGTIVAGGWLGDYGEEAATPVVIRLLPDGSFDSSFGAAGVAPVVTDSPTESMSVMSLGLLGDGTVTALIATSGGTRLGLGSAAPRLVRLKRNGLPLKSYGDNGSVGLPGPAGIVPRAMAPALDGSVAVVEGDNAHFITMRLTSAGAADPSFDGDGVVIDSVGKTGVVVVDAAPTASGGVLVLAITNLGDTLLRYRPDGTPDSGLGGAGVFAPDLSAPPGPMGEAAGFAPSHLAVDVTGRILLGGSYVWVKEPPPSPPGLLCLDGPDCGTELPEFHYHPAVLRLLPSGARDGSFGTGGLVIVDPAGAEGVGGPILAVPNGDIVLAGTPNQGGELVVRLRSSGVLDTTFSADGVATDTLSTSPVALVRQSDYRVVVVGRQWTTVRYGTTGAVDAGFGTGGVARPPFSGGAVSGATIQADDRVVATGSRGPSAKDLGVVRFTTTGLPDASFGSGGSANVNFGTSALGYDVAIGPTGQILVGGIIGNCCTPSEDFTVIGLTPAGILDGAFGTGGTARLDLAQGRDRIYRLFLLGGRLLMAGQSRQRNDAADAVTVAAFLLS